jgi:hypothetical protein
MGMFDHVRCKYQLPDAEAQELEFQTKSTAGPSLDNYIVTPDGRPLHEEYDVRLEENAKSPFGIYFHRENPRWVQAEFQGQLEIHTSVKQADETLRWYSYLFWFKDNRVADLRRGKSWGEVIPPSKRPEAPNTSPGTSQNLS